MDRHRSRFFALVCALAAVLAGSQAFAEKRVALVIGNAAYRNVTALPNPGNDASAMADLFRRAGFDRVEVRRDLDIAGLRNAVREFSELTRNADVAVVFFAGHGIEVDGVNYLIPTDARLRRDFDVEDETVPLDRVLRALEPARRLRLVILDACRDNPFVPQMRRAAVTRSVGRGLARVEPSISDTLIAYAARAGTIATDGAGKHSPFTAALLKHIAAPGMDLRIAMGHVRDDVLAATGRRQEPYVTGSLGGGLISLVAVGSPIEQAERERLARAAREQAAREQAAREQAERDKHEYQAQLALQAQREQQEREQAEQDRLERERLAREKLEREKAQQAAAAGPQPNTQVALLTPLPVPRPSPPPLSGGALILEIKKELARVGCYGGPIDERWSTTATQSSVKSFVKFAGLPSGPAQPGIDFLDAIRGKSDRVCPLECSPRQIEQDGRCVAKTCPDGERLAANGSCAASGKQQPGQKNSGAQGSQKRCFVLGGKSYCQ